MGLFSRFRSTTPAPIQEAIDAQGMSLSGGTMLPGAPIPPSHGYSTGVRGSDYPVGANITIKPRVAYGRPSFDTLRKLIDAWDLARACINHKIDDLRSMELLYSPADGFEDDASTAVKAARAALAYPDRELPFALWLSKFLEGVWRYDAGCLYRRRNRAGEIIGLEVVDGTSITPYIDEYGRRPQPPAPAYAQIVHGVDYEWLTSDDLIYLPFRPQLDSPYGLAPIESLILTANTDLRFQKYFLDYFTAGSIPGGLLEAPPDASTPNQVGEWQDYWDALLIGDQEALRQIKVVPNGMHLDPQREASFDENFPIYLMRRTCALFGVTPQDLGITLDVNRANSDTQVDIQFRVNTLPGDRFVSSILTRYLQDDLGLPVKVEFDDGQEKEDRLADAQAWQIKINTGAASPDDWRQDLGLPIDNERPFPRGIMSSRLGFIPMAAILNIAGPVDVETAAPVDSQPLQLETFDGTPGLLPYKPPGGAQFKRAPIDPDEPSFPQLEKPVPGTGVEQQGVENPVHSSSARIAKERAAFARFVKARAKSGRWRDFAFTDIPAGQARELNKDGRAQVRKDAGQTAAAGLAVVAQDTGRVLLLQRAQDDGPASGLWELPGGHLEGDETAKQAAYREWQEETGLLLPYVPESPDITWTAGAYQGFVWVVPQELDIAGRGAVINPDDPDGDITEAIAWWDPALIEGNPAVRPELVASAGVVLDAVLQALASDAVVKAGGNPKGWRANPPGTPHAAFDLAITDHYQPQIRKALQALWPDLHAAVTSAASTPGAEAAAAVEALGQPNLELLRTTLQGLQADSWAAGAHAASIQTRAAPGVVQVAMPPTDWDHWEPGHITAADLEDDGGFQTLLQNAGITLDGIADSAARLVGDGIADGLRQGKSVTSIARTVASLVGSESRAELIAHTETARAMSQASMNLYQQVGVAEWDLITTAGACPICLDIAAANPHPVGSDAPPEHPRCRCAPAPHTP